MVAPDPYVTECPDAATLARWVADGLLTAREVAACRAYLARRAATVQP